MKYTNSQIEQLLEGIYDGRINVRKLPKDLYTAIAEYLEGGITKGFKIELKLLESGSRYAELFNLLYENIYIFSAAKTYQQVREMSEQALTMPTFKEFRDAAMETYSTYNKDWLEAEYNTAVGQSTQAAQWAYIEDNAELFPYLQYSAVIDDRTSDICEPIDGVVLPVSDPFWDTFTPLNHFNCRCTLIMVDKYTDVKPTKKEAIGELSKTLSETVQPAFQMNPGKDGYIFNPDEHPYFSVAPQDKEWAKENFGLPIPTK